MRKITQNREFYSTTETRSEFVDPGLPIPYPPKRPTDADVLIEADVHIYGKLLNKLFLNSPTTLAGPVRLIGKSMDESLNSYITKIKCQYPHICLNVKTIDDILRKRGTTEYHTSYCTLKDMGFSKRMQDSKKSGIPESWYTDTSYQSAYRSPDQIREVAVIHRTYPHIPINKDEALAKAIRKIFAFEKSSYQVDYNEIGKKHCLLPQAYMDRYS